MAAVHRLFKKVLMASGKERTAVELGGMSFDPAADVFVRSVGKDYVLVELHLGGTVREISIPFAAIQYVTAKRTGSFLAS